MSDLGARLRALDHARKRLPRRRSYGVALLAALVLVVYGARPGTLGEGGWTGPTGEVLAYVRCGWTNEVTVHVNPRLAGRDRALARVHEAVHVDDAREVGCFVFNLSGRLSPRVRLEREARAHCAELRHRLAGLDQALAGLPEEERRRRGERAVRFGLRRIVVNLMSVEAYSGISDLGVARVRAAVHAACGVAPPPAPAPASVGVEPRPQVLDLQG